MNWNKSVVSKWIVKRQKSSKIKGDFHSVIAALVNILAICNLGETNKGCFEKKYTISLVFDDIKDKTFPEI